MAAFRILKVNHLMPLLDHASSHFAGVAGVDAVVFGVGPEKDFGIRCVGGDALVGGVLGDEGVVFWNVRVAVFGHPAGAGQQLVVAQHVDKGDGADDGVEQVGALHHDGGGEQAAIAAAADAEVGGAGEAGGDQVFGDGDEVIEDALAVLENRGLMPLRAVFAAAANVGEHEAAACKGRESI